MAKLGRPFKYDSEDEKPVTISLRIPKDLHAQLKQYAWDQRLNVTELLLDGLRWRLGLRDSHPPEPQPDIPYYDNTVIQQRSAPEVSVPDTIPTEAPPVTEEAASAFNDNERGLEIFKAPSGPQRKEAEAPDQEAESTPSFDTTKYKLGKLCPRGHEWGQTGQTRLKLINDNCPVCDREKARERRQARKAPTAEGKR